MTADCWTTPLFTQPDAWTGGSYELAIELGPLDDRRLERALQAVWRFPDVEGCFEHHDVEPKDQPRIVLPAGDLDLTTCLRGLAVLGPGRVVPCSTVPVREPGGADWLYFGLPLGSLSNVLPVGAFPFDDGTSLSWRVGLDAWLRRLASHVYATVGFDLALVGWTDACDDTAASVAATGVPGERWVGYLIPAGDALDWTPGNQAAPVSIRR